MLWSQVNIPNQNHAWISKHAKASNALKLYAFPESHKAFFITNEGRLAIMGSYEGSKTTLSANLERLGVPFKIYPRTFTADIDPENLKELLSIPEVIYVDAATRFNAPRKLDDKALAKSNVSEAQNIKNPSLMGDDIVVGIVDVGFQTTHPTFFNETGTQYRVKRFWQQKYANQMGPAPYKYGILKNSEAEILAENDNDGSHGTHVAGIAAGSGFKSPDLKYAGVAPKSDLVFVGIRYRNDSIPGSALGDYLVANNAIIDGFDYVFSYADSVGKPAVCNLSWGMHTGPHDGTSLFDRALEDLMNTPNSQTGKTQGRALVGANGNSAQHEMHVQINLNADTAATLAMDRSRNYYRTENVYCDFWAEKGGQIQYQIVLIDSQDNPIVQTSYRDFSEDASFSETLSYLDDTLFCLIAGTQSYPHNDKANVLMMIESNKNNRFIKINFKGTGTVHGWNSGRTYEWTAGTFRNYIRSYKPTHWVNGDAKHTLGENGGTSKAILSVGSYNNRVNWLNFQNKFQSDSAVDEGEISGFSSWGPALDGRLKPDISAPGQFIANAYHKDAVPGWLSPYVVHKDVWNNDDVYWVLLSGTSMASPHVAGVMALVLQASKGQLSAETMYDLIRSSAQRDAYTGNTENFQYGAGKVDAYKAVIASMNAMRNNHIDEEKPLIIANAEALELFNLKRNVHQVNYSLYETSGRLRYKGTSASKVLPIPGVKTGLYFVQVDTEGSSFTQTVWIETEH